jgi:hypothetical protein
MGWYGPDQCEEHCCEPPTPCTKPVVVCRKSDNPQRFYYTITDADEAWIDETCPSSGGGTTVTSYPITLSSRAADSYYNTSAGCTYCVRAINTCGTTVCCDICTTPTCSLSVTRNAYGYLEIAWRYDSNSVTDLVISADLGGIDVFSLGMLGAGSMTVDISSLTLESATYSGVEFHDLVLTVTNDCGKVTKCRFTVPCCWEYSQTRVSITGLSDTYTETIDTETRPIGGNHLQFYNKHSMKYEGLAAFNGTHLLNNAIPQWPNARTADTCDASTNFIEIGSLKVTEEITANGREFSTSPFRDWDYSIKYEAVFTAYLGSLLRGVPAGLSGYGGGFYYQFASVTIVDSLVYHPNGSNPGFSFGGTRSGCTRNFTLPLSALCVNDGVYRLYEWGAGFFGTAVPAQLDGGMTGIQHQPPFYCRSPQTRDFFAPSRFATIIGALAFNGFNTTQYCPIHEVVFPDAVELEYV